MNNIVLDITYPNLFSVANKSYHADCISRGYRIMNFSLPHPLRPRVPSLRSAAGVLQRYES